VAWQKAFPASRSGSLDHEYWITVLTAEKAGRRWWKLYSGAAELPRGAGEFGINLLPSLVISKKHVVSVGDRW